MVCKNKIKEVIMSLEDFIITVYCLLDEELKKMLKEQKLRQSGRF